MRRGRVERALKIDHRLYHTIRALAPEDADLAEIVIMPDGRLVASSPYEFLCWSGADTAGADALQPAAPVAFSPGDVPSGVHRLSLIARKSLRAVLDERTLILTWRIGGRNGRVVEHVVPLREPQWLDERLQQARNIADRVRAAYGDRAPSYVFTPQLSAIIASAADWADSIVIDVGAAGLGGTHRVSVAARRLGWDGSLRWEIPVAPGTPGRLALDPRRVARVFESLPGRWILPPSQASQTPPPRVLLYDSTSTLAMVAGMRE